MHICSYRPNLGTLSFNLAYLLYRSPASQYCQIKPKLVNETRAIRGLEITRKPAEKRRTRRADIPIPSVRSMIRSFWSDVSLVVTPCGGSWLCMLVAYSLNSAVMLYYLCRSVLDVSDSLESPAGKSDTRSKYEYRVWYLMFSQQSRDYGHQGCDTVQAVKYVYMGTNSASSIKMSMPL